MKLLIHLSLFIISCFFVSASETQKNYDMFLSCNKKQDPDYMKNETGKYLKLSEIHFNTKKANFMNSSKACR